MLPRPKDFTPCPAPKNYSSAPPQSKKVCPVHPRALITQYRSTQFILWFSSERTNLNDNEKCFLPAATPGEVLSSCRAPLPSFNTRTLPPFLCQVWKVFFNWWWLQYWTVIFLNDFLCPSIFWLILKHYISQILASSVVSFSITVQRLCK